MYMYNVQCTCTLDYMYMYICALITECTNIIYTMLCTCTQLYCDYNYMYVHVHVHIQCILGLRKRFECSNIRLFAVHLKLNFSLRSFAAMPTLMFAHAHLCNLNVWSIMWACSRKVRLCCWLLLSHFLC